MDIYKIFINLAYILLSLSKFSDTFLFTKVNNLFITMYKIYNVILELLFEFNYLILMAKGIENLTTFVCDLTKVFEFG
jgi:hypothetical protein